MRRFEYYHLHLRHDDPINVRMDVFGRNGWEAYAVMPFKDGIAVYLKRELQNQTEP